MVDEAGSELERLVRVTGLGVGLDQSGRLSESSMRRTAAALGEFRRSLVHHRVDSLRVVATAACRGAENAEEFLNLAELALETRAEIISADEEARLAYAGVSGAFPWEDQIVVIDIGGGSTEFVSSQESCSVEIGSVRITDRMLGPGPVGFDVLQSVSEMVDELLSQAPKLSGCGIGVAGTWTSLAAMSLRLPAYDPVAVHGSVIDRTSIDRLVGLLAGLTVDEIAGIPSMDPNRAPVILGGALIARGAIRRLDMEEVKISERDLLDGVVAGLP